MTFWFLDFRVGFRIGGEDVIETESICIETSDSFPWMTSKILSDLLMAVWEDG